MMGGRVFEAFDGRREGGLDGSGDGSAEDGFDD
jgi:hypothetical protein